MTSRTDRAEHRTWKLPALCVLAGAIFAAGCNVVGPIAAVAQGPGEVEAAYEDLDPDRKTVIFVDDPAGKIAQRRTRSRIGVVAQDELLRRKLVHEGAMIDARSALAVAEQGGAQDMLSITEIGEALEADVVIYVLITRFDLFENSVNYVPTAEVEVKVFDAVNHARLWPPQGQPGYRATFSRSRGNADLPRSRTDFLQAESELAEVTGLGIAQLFYDVERPQSLRR